jgi:hypothetical protein
MRASIVVGASALVATWMGLVGCSATDVIVAQQQPPDASPAPDAGGPPPTTCHSMSDCPSSAYCQKTSCGDAQGTCTLRPVSCPSDESDVCGCDGVVYWNDCLRQRDGVESAISGFCGAHFSTCGRPDDPPCPVDDGVCVRIAPRLDMCEMPDGFCWVPPDSCPPDAGGERLASCTMPPVCTDLCQALISQASALADGGMPPAYARVGFGPSPCPHQ